jgi:hypothetical protein
MLSTFLLAGDSSELAAADDPAASDELAFASRTSASATFSLRADDDAGCEDPEDGACSTRDSEGGLALRRRAKNAAAAAAARTRRTTSEAAAADAAAGDRPKRREEEFLLAPTWATEASGGGPALSIGGGAVLRLRPVAVSR